MQVHRPLDIKPGDLRCPRCLAKDIVPSWPRGVRDGIYRLLGLVPRHCRPCGKRFHVRRSRIAASRTA